MNSKQLHQWIFVLLTNSALRVCAWQVHNITMVDNKRSLNIVLELSYKQVMVLKCLQMRVKIVIGWNILNRTNGNISQWYEMISVSSRWNSLKDVGVWLAEVLLLTDQKLKTYSDDIYSVASSVMLLLYFGWKCHKDVYKVVVIHMCCVGLVSCWQWYPNCFLCFHWVGVLKKFCKLMSGCATWLRVNGSLNVLERGPEMFEISTFSPCLNYYYLPLTMCT